MPSASLRTWLLRLLVVAVAAGIALFVLPRAFGPAEETPPAVLHGALGKGRIAYREAPLADVLEDIDRLSGFRVVAFPEVAALRFTGELAIDKGGEQAVRAMAARLGLRLKQAGPHWALVPERKPNAP